MKRNIKPLGQQLLVKGISEVSSIIIVNPNAKETQEDFPKAFQVVAKGKDVPDEIKVGDYVEIFSAQAIARIENADDKQTLESVRDLVASTDEKITPGKRTTVHLYFFTSYSNIVGTYDYTEK